jgi:soluble lytic murein transglycosylase-like protein
MDALKLGLAVLALGASVPARADPVDRWAPEIAAASARCGLPAEWIERVMRAESGGRTQLYGKPIVSGAGAMGLMQLMPGTWAEMRAALGLGENPHDPRENILAGACYLRRMYDRFGYPGLFAAYNAGPGRYRDHLATGRILPVETRRYLAALIGQAAVSPVVPARPGSGAIFFPLRAMLDRPREEAGSPFALRRADVPSGESR